MFAIKTRAFALLTVAVIVSGMAVRLTPADAVTRVASPRISVPDMIVGEDARFIDVPVTLSAPGRSVVTVNLNAQNGTAVNNWVCPTPNCFDVLTFAPGQTTRNVRIQILNDTVVLPFESFYLQLSSPTNATIAKATGQISIVDNDTVVATPRLFIRDAIVDEKDGIATVPVLIGGPTGGASNSVVTVHYATKNGTATAGSDYTPASGTLTFARGDSVKNVVVHIADDARHEAAERFQVILSQPTHATIGDGTGDIVIGASDGLAAAAPRISLYDLVVSEGVGYVDAPITLSAPSRNVVTVNLNAENGTAVNNWACPTANCLDVITFAPGQTTRSVRIQILNDNVVLPFESFFLQLSSPTNATIAKATGSVGINDNDG